MSGLGKTHLAQILRGTDSWFHYSIDYRIGTAYMGEYIADNLKREAMAVPYLARHLRSDSIYIGSNITFDNLEPLSAYLGQPGDARRGGLPIDLYRERQALHVRAEVNALLDTPAFVARAGELYGYPHFVCDTGGSICEVVDPEDRDDPVLTVLSRHTLPVWIEGGARTTRPPSWTASRPRAQAHVLPSRLPRRRLGAAPGPDGRRAGRGRSRGLRLRGLCRRHRRTGAPLRRHRARMGA